MSDYECPCGSSKTVVTSDLVKTDYGYVEQLGCRCLDCGSDFATGEQITKNAEAMRELKKAGKFEMGGE